MKKYNFSLIRFFLSLLILFSFSTIVKALDYELLIITPKKFETVAQQFLTLHQNAAVVGNAQPMRGCYAIVEELVDAYDGGSGVGEDAEEPSEAPAPPVPGSPTEDINGFDYPPDIDPHPNLCIIKFLRGVLKFEEEHVFNASWGWDHWYALDLLHDVSGATGIIADEEDADFQYLLLLGETGAAGGASMSFSGVPESWYVRMHHDDYPDQMPWSDGSIFPTDFFYASPDYYDGLDWTPNLRVGRIPVHDLDPVADTGLVTEITAITEDITNPYSMNECDVCDSIKSWVPDEWTDYELWIVSDGNPDAEPPPPLGTGTDAPIGATYLILSNTDTCLRVLGNPSAAGLEAEDASDTENIIPGDGYEIHDNGLDEAQAIYDKCEDYLTAVEVPTAWNDWFRKVVTAGGDSWPGLFSFWDEFVLAHITNLGYFEGNEITKLRHTNKDDGVAGNDFNLASVHGYLDDDDCGLLFHLGLRNAMPGYLVLDDFSISTTDVQGYTSLDSHIPIMVSNSNYHGRFDLSTSELTGAVPPYIPYPSFGEMVVESPAGGGGIAYIGSTDSTYSGIMPSFDNGVLSQDRLYNFDELLSYTMRSFHSAPNYIGDMFMGSSSVPGGQARGPINSFVDNNDMTFWSSQKTVWTYILLGDPALPIPYPASSPIETGTSAPTLAFDETTLRDRVPQYESHGIGVDEMTGGVIDTTVNISTTTPPLASAVPEVKITLIDIRRDEGEHYFEPGIVPSTYDLVPLADEPGYYFVKVEQPGYDNMASGWGSWWEKEQWIYVQEVNTFTPTKNILVVDDDFGYPIVTTTYTAGYEDWYLTALDNVPAAGNYDVWHVDFDDDLFNTNYSPATGTGDDWTGVDAGDALMHGEVYQDLLANYDKVIWLTGGLWGYWRPEPYPSPESTIWMMETLTLPEQTYLENYLDSGGRLFLSGQGIIADFLNCLGHGLGYFGWCEEQNTQNEFLSNYLHLTDIYTVSGYETLSQLRSVPSNPVIIDSYGINISGLNGAENQLFFVVSEPETDTPIVSKIFEYDFASGGEPPFLEGDIGDTPFFGTAGTAYYRGLGANIFFPWNFEAIDNQGNRNEVMSAILSWLDNPTRTGAGEDEGGNGGDDGSGGSGGTGSLKGCFIATACYGMPMAEEVKTLSDFRDEYLMANPLGRFFVRNYYKFSPQLAEYISQRPMLKKFVRIGLKPLVRFSEKLITQI